MIKWLDSLPDEERLKELGPFKLEKPQGDLIIVFQNLKCGYKEDKDSFHKQPCCEDKREWVQVALGEVSSLQKKEILYSENNHWSKITKDLVASLSMEVFKMRLDRVLHNLIQVPLSMKIEPDDLSRSLPTWAVLWFYDPINPTQRFFRKLHYKCHMIEPRNSKSFQLYTFCLYITVRSNCTITYLSISYFFSHKFRDRCNIF